MDNVWLYSKLAALPEQLKTEVSDFIDLLIAKSRKDSTDADLPKPKFGSGKGMFVMHNDFDAPLEDFKDYMN